MKKLIERPAGTGTVTRADGTRVGQRRYTLHVYREYHAPDIPGQFLIEGRIHVDADEGAALVMAGQSLTLTLEDQRVLDFEMTDAGGTIANVSQRFRPLGS